MFHFVTLIFWSLEVQMLVEQESTREHTVELKPERSFISKKVLFYL